MVSDVKKRRVVSRALGSTSRFSRTTAAMGAGASSMNRLRKALVMRAYNLRDPGQTLEDFFKAYTYRKVCCLHCLLTDSLHLIGVGCRMGKC
jgi:hypothetical protein